MTDLRLGPVLHPVPGLLSGSWCRGAAVPREGSSPRQDSAAQRAPPWVICPEEGRCTRAFHVWAALSPQTSLLTLLSAHATLSGGLCPMLPAQSCQTPSDPHSFPASFLLSQRTKGPSSYLRPAPQGPQIPLPPHSCLCLLSPHTVCHSLLAPSQQTASLHENLPS